MYVVAAEVVCPSPQSSLRLDLGSYRLPQLHCWILPSTLVDCVVPKNRAGLSTHAAPGSPLTFIQKVAHRSPWRSSSKGRLSHPTTKGKTGWWSRVSSGHRFPSLAITIDPTYNALFAITPTVPRTVLLPFETPNYRRINEPSFVSFRMQLPAKPPRLSLLVHLHQIPQLNIMKSISCNVYETKFCPHIP